MLLKAVSLSRHTPVAALEALAVQARERQVGAGATIGSGDDQPRGSAFVVVDGRVAVYQGGLRLNTLRPGKAYGLLETLAGADADIEARAELDTLLLEIPAPTLLSVLEGHHLMTRETIHALARMVLVTPSWLARTMERPMELPELVPPESLDLVDRIGVLQTSGIFSHAHDGSLAEVASYYDEFRAPPGTILWREGDMADWLFVLLEGGVESRSRTNVRLSWIPRMVPGVFEVLGGAPRWTDATAATPIRGLRLSTKLLFDAIENNFAMAADLLSSLAQRVCRQRFAIGGLHGHL